LRELAFTTKQYSDVSSRNTGAEKVNFVGKEALELVATSAALTVTVENGTMIPVGIPFSISRISRVTGRVESLDAKYRSIDVKNAPPGLSTIKLCATGST